MVTGKSARFAISSGANFRHEGRGRLRRERMRWVMDWVLALLLFLHIFGAIVAFGPTYSFILLGPMVGREPQHANFAIRYQRLVSRRMIAPLAVLQGVTGLLIVWKTNVNILATPWLMVAIVLYIFALAISFGILLPTASKLVEATSTPPPPAAPGSPPPSGPPPHIAALVRRARMAGMANAILIVIIVFLMVTKPF
jgi:hypothetical protein